MEVRMIYDLSDALISLYPNEKFAISNNDYSTLVWSSDLSKPTLEELETKRDQMQTDYNAKQYQRDRLQEYPSIQELVVALYDEEDKQALIEKRNAVKAKYPKPE